MNLPTTVTLTDARRNLEDIVERAERGEVFLITRYGKPVGCILPIDVGRALYAASTAAPSPSQP